ncbi:MAG: Glyoxylase, beta-lactamase superfamily [Sporomusa sp.]|jgi:glyoxylase-like metal-dependent hydrolase (beta-lactamase superfamily II)|nr:Glyoxylase, beta-lactamase superfamily [Sporomusa sp.]
MKLLKLRENVFYIRGFVNIGVIANARGDALLVDAGLDERTARRVEIVLDENKLTIKGIIITHAHADHYGGACYLSEHSGARIYASELEKAVINNPILEALGLFGGAYPPAELRRKFFNAPRVAVHETVSPGAAEIEGIPLEIVDLSGHTLGQIGVAVEKVLFCADSIASPGQMQRQGLLKNASIEQSLKTCERLKSRNDLIFVPSHGNVLSNIRPLIDENQEWINHILSLILSMTNEPIGVEDLLARICAKKAVSIKGVSQYYVLHLSILAYLGCLLDREQISVAFSGNKQLFQRRSIAEVVNLYADEAK